MRRVLVVDDSPRLRSVVANGLASREYDVVPMASPSTLIETVSEVEPDVLLIGLATLDGLEQVERALSVSPTPSLVVGPCPESELDGWGEVFRTDAVEYLQAPAELDDGGADFLARIETTIERLSTVDKTTLAVAQTAASTRAIQSAGTATAVPATDGPSAQFRSLEPASKRQPARTRDVTDRQVEQRPPALTGPTRTPTEPPTIVIGASTGGPAVLEGVLEGLSIDLAARVLIVQHMPRSFTGKFADRLDGVGEYAVSEARDGQPIRPKTAVVAPGDTHLGIDLDATGTVRVALEDGPHRNGVRPSIDVTMEQVADRLEGPLCGVVLTGMGRDGASGIEAIDAAGGVTIAQDEATSHIFGIPAKAIQTGCIDDIVPANELPARITAAIMGEIDE